MPVRHVVRQGEHGSAIAEKYGFARLRTVWSDPANAGLREKRQTPDILLPGDEVAIPDKAARDEPAGTGQSHTFVLLADKVRVRLQVRDLAGSPLAGHPCQFTVEDRPAICSTDENGVIDSPASRSVAKARLRIDDSDFDVDVGRLDPIEEDSGWQARLINLGYLEKPDPSLSAQAQIRTRELQAAIEEFQCDQGLPLTGAMDDATVSALRDVHGC